MPGWDIFTRDIREFFTTSRTRSVRRQYEFHLKVSEPLADAAFSGPEADWNLYYEELGRAAVARDDGLEARWLRAKAAHHWFRELRHSGAAQSRTREIVGAWDRDLRILLTRYDKKAPASIDLDEVRVMRETFDRLCRCIKTD